MLEIILKEENLLFLVFIGSFLLTYVVIPKIIAVVEHRELMDNPNKRSSHTKITPTLGGISFFITLIVFFFFLFKWDENNIFVYIIPGLTLLFITGLKDDIVVLSPISKLIAQIVAVVFILSNSVMQIHTLNGFLGIEEIHLYLSFPLSVFLMVTIINAYNLIDGIDGLASITGMIISVVFGILFYYLGLLYFTLLCVVVFAILLAFLRYNFSSNKKIFMGDTGSLLIGLMLAVFSVRFLAITPEKLVKLPFDTENIPFIVVAILIVPLFDLVRVFAIRLLGKKSPFSPDRNHLHHILIDFGASHKTASLLIGLFNILFIGLILFSATIFRNRFLFFVFIIVIAALTYILYRLNFRFSNQKKRVYFKRKINKIKAKLFSNNKSE